MPRPRSPNPTAKALRSREAYARFKNGMRIAPTAYDDSVVDWLISTGSVTEAQLNQTDKKVREEIGQIFTDIIAHLARKNYSF